MQQEPLDQPVAAPAPLLTATELGALADAWWAAKTKRLAADKVANLLKTEEARLDASIIDQMLRQQISSIGGATVIVSLPTPTMEPAVKDWPAFWEFMKQQDDMSLLSRHLGRAAIKERWAAGQEIPGIAQFPVYKLSKTGVK